MLKYLIKAYSVKYLFLLLESVSLRLDFNCLDSSTALVVLCIFNAYRFLKQNFAVQMDILLSKILIKNYSVKDLKRYFYLFFYLGCTDDLIEYFPFSRMAEFAVP